MKRYTSFAITFMLLFFLSACGDIKGPNPFVLCLPFMGVAAATSTSAPPTIPTIPLPITCAILLGFIALSVAMGQSSKKPQDTEQTDTKPVEFSAYFSPKAKVNQKSGLYVYAYTPEAKIIIENDIKRYTDELGGAIPTPREANKTVRIPIGTSIKVVPECEELEIEPQTITKRWRGDWSRFEFEIVPTANLVNKILFIRISIQMEEIEIAHIKCAVDVIVSDDTSKANMALETSGFIAPQSAFPTNPLAAAKFEVQSTTPYQRIFISYSRRDSRVARAFKIVQTALGHDVFLDVDNLRAGENWRAALAKAIDDADIFQLFWSKDSANSEYCKYEWDYALEYRASSKKEGFIRPVYWEKPMPTPPPELADLNFKYCEFENIAD